MQPRSLQQVLTELDSVYNPQIDNLRTRQAGLPGQMQAEEQGLKAQESDYFDNTIMADARRRGVGFGGIPQGERARYGSTQFLPALARLKQQSKDQAMSLEDAILGIQERRNTQGQGIYENEQNRFEQRRQFDVTLEENRRQAAAQRASAANNQIIPSTGYNSLGQQVNSILPQQRKDKGFNFTDKSGRPISAAAYAVATGVPFRQVLQDMAQSGDDGAKRALGFVGDDFGYDPRKVADKSTAGLYNNLTWGVARQASPYARLANDPRY